MTDRKWRIINENNKNAFYEKISKYEQVGYELLPESFSASEASNGRKSFNCLMKNKNSN